MASKKSSKSVSSSDDRDSELKSVASRMEQLAPMLADALLNAQYRREWVGANNAASLLMISRRRFDDLKRLERIPEAERWIAGKQVWNRLTIEQLKDGIDQGDLGLDISQDDADELRRRRAATRENR